LEPLLLKLQILDAAGGERRVEARVERDVTVAELKARHFGDAIAEGWRPRCFFLGRLLGDGEPVAQLPSGSVLQCYLQRVQGSRPSTEREGYPEWARAASAHPTHLPACPKWQDFLFHSTLAVGFALAWGAYLAVPSAFDAFSRFALRFFSLAWAAVLTGDVLTTRGTS